MALRFEIPIKVFPELRSDKTPTAAPPVMRAAHTVEFRPAADFSKVVDEITRYKRVKLGAPAGAGKTTVIPVMLADALQKPVVLAVPSVFLADDHYTYMKKQFPGKVSLALEEDDVVQGKGVTITSFPWLAGKVLQAKGGAKPFGDFVLVADEVHESDGYSDFVRRMGSTIPGVTQFIEMSATHDPVGMQRLESKGDLETTFFERCNPDQWNPDDDGKPWSSSGLTGNVAIFLDDNKIASRMQTAYARAGVSAYRLHSRMSRAECKAALAEMRDPNAPIVVLIADYSFRDGFTLSCNKIIESALVKYAVVQDGMLAFRYRTLYECEKYQTMARGAREPGTSCKYYIPAGVDFPTKLSVLEGMEMEAAALLLRAYGYGAPAEMKALRFPDGKMPRDLASALNGFVPLALLADADLVDDVLPRVDTAVQEVADLMESYGIDDSPVRETSDLFPEIGALDQPDVKMAFSVDFLRQLQTISSSHATLTQGYYYQCADAVRDYSLGDVSAEELATSLHERPIMVTGMSPAQKLDGIALLLLEYNKCVLTQAALSRVSAQTAAITKMSSMYPEQVRSWSKWVADQGQIANVMSASYLKIVDKLRSPGVTIRRVESDGDLEEKRAAAMAGPLLAAIEAASKVIDRKSFFDEIGGSEGLIDGPDFPKLEAVKPSASFRGKIAWKSRRVGRSVLWDLKLLPDDPMRWDAEKCALAVRDLLEDKGVVPAAVGRLFVDAPNVDPNRVMQTVRDGLAPGKNRRIEFVVTPATRKGK